MKQLVKVSALIVAGIGIMAFTNKPKVDSFEGVITYEIKVDGGNDNPQVAQMMQGMSQKEYIKSGKLRVEQNSMMGSSIVIYDAAQSGKPIILVNAMGNKYQIKLDDNDAKKAEKDTPEIKYLTGTKNIAGYDCKEAEVTYTDRKTNNKVTTDVFYTDQLPMTGESKFKGIKGFPLSFSAKDHGMTMSYTATSITKQSVPDSMFVAPPGYKLVTGEEMQKDMMSKMGGGGGN